MHKIIIYIFAIKQTKHDLIEWHNECKKDDNIKESVEIALIGKYVSLHDAYISIYEALNHAGVKNKVNVKIRWVDSEEIEKNSAKKILEGVDGVIVPGGFGNRGIEGIIQGIRYARENKLPIFGICLGMQLMVVEFFRDVVGIKDANSLEFNPNTKNAVINLMEEQLNVSKKGGTMRLGKYPCTLDIGTKAYDAYKENLIYERHRHRYEFNNEYRKLAEENGLKIAGVSPDNKLVEIVEIENNPWAVGVQFHPELKSRPNTSHPLFKDFILAVKDNKKK